MNSNDTITVQPPLLTGLSRVRLNAHYEGLLAVGQTRCAGSAMWRHRKMAEARDLLALAQVSERLRVHWMDQATDLRVLLEMTVRVPCLPDRNGPLQVAGIARLGLIYREEALRIPQPGYTYVQVVAPGAVWHPNVSADANQVLCLGPSLPAGIPLKEIVLMAYGALTMMAVQMNLGDAAGVMNPAAAEWWQRNTHLIPLSKEPFIRQTSTRL